MDASCNRFVVDKIHMKYFPLPRTKSELEENRDQYILHLFAIVPLTILAYMITYIISNNGFRRYVAWSRHGLEEREMLHELLLASGIFASTTGVTMASKTLFTKIWYITGQTEVEDNKTVPGK